MKFETAVGIAAAIIVAVVAAGCGGSSGPESSVNGCEIQPAAACAGADLSGADLAGADLSQSDLADTNLDGANLSGANLTGANLSGAQIVDADLSDADLTRANLSGATITGTNLDGATLCGTISTNGTTDDSSCPSPTDTTDTIETTETTDSTTSTEASVTSFAVGEPDCSEGSDEGSVTVSWATQDATAVELDVDDEKARGEGTSGSATIAIPCDGGAHNVSVTALSDSGVGETKTEEISTSS